MSDYTQEYHMTGRLSTTKELLEQFRDRIDKLIERNE